jgi:hypothetical protein
VRADQVKLQHSVFLSMCSPSLSGGILNDGASSGTGAT